MKKLLFMFISLVLLLLSSCILDPIQYENKYFVYQLQNLDIDEIITYPINYLVMDYTRDGKESSKYSNEDIKKIKQMGIIPLAYISIGKLKIIDIIGKVNGIQLLQNGLARKTRNGKVIIR
ncbi:hypothetical protein [Marinitoga lauensis]|uniref:hypothetical protein n=1 Tax=Marinitoga lauensis TaxID=2201189 RepID=UPI00197CD831|nr:hypothetical protein [Marinitoga lauensis]